MKTGSSKLAAFVIAALAVPQVGSAMDFKLNGFSSVGYSELDTEKAEYAPSTYTEGINGKGTLEYDSMAGVQVTAVINDAWSAVVQGVVRKQTNGDFGPNLDWAYVKWSPSAKFFLRVGQTRVATFYQSDSYFLSYATPWVRPPLEVYGLSPVYLLQGVDAMWRTSIGPVSLDVQAFYGDSDLEVYGTTKLDPAVPPKGSDTIKMKDWAGVLLTAHYEDFTFRAGYSDKTMTEEWVVLQPLVTALGRFGYAELGKDIGFKDAKTPITDLAVHYDDGTNFALAEWAERDSNSLSIVHLQSHYLTAGRRFGPVAPYATYAYAKVMSDRENHTIQVPTTGSPVVIGTLRVLDAKVNGIVATVSDQETLSAGVQYELPAFSFVQGALLKAQVDRIDPKDGGKGYLSVATPGFSDVVYQYSLSLNVIF